MCTTYRKVNLIRETLPDVMCLRNVCRVCVQRFGCVLYVLSRVARTVVLRENDNDNLPFYVPYFESWACVPFRTSSSGAAGREFVYC